LISRGESRYAAVTSVTTGRLEIGVDRLVDRLAGAGDGERGQAGVRVVRRQRRNGGQTASQGVGDFTRVAAGPDAGAVDAAAAAVEEHAVGHHVDELLPAIHLVVAEEDLGETRPVRLHARIPAVSIHGGRAAENQVAAAAVEHGGADVAAARIHGDCLARHTRREEGFGHAIGRPGFLRTRLENETDLQRDDRQPQRMNAGRIRRQDQTHTGLCA
jgi:hypothetical protein